MSIGWLNPAAFWGLALIALPIAIHLLVRQQTRTVEYPSLRFVRETALASFRRRAIQDAVLLACRIAIVIAAVLALAGPILRSDARTAEYAKRLSRAVVQLDDSAPDSQLTPGTFRAEAFRRPTIADALNDAVRWLDSQPPSSREIVLTGSLRRGQVAQSDLHFVPAEIGLRFAATPAATPADRFRQTTLIRRNGRLEFVSHDVRLTTDATHIGEAAMAPAPEDAIRVVASTKDQPLADAALRAALDAGLRWPDRNRRVVVMWDGASPTPHDADVVRMAVPNPSATAATALWNAVDASTTRELIEPVAIPPDVLAAWSRPPQGVSPDARPADEGDRRWLWATVLALLGIEHWLRREGPNAVSQPEERRVA